jgi:hypothetical protein
MKYAYPMEEAARIRFCAALLPSRVRGEWGIAISSKSARQYSMCAIGMSGGCRIQRIPNVVTTKLAFIPCIKACPGRKKLLPRCYSQREQGSPGQLRCSK